MYRYKDEMEEKLWALIIKERQLRDLPSYSPLMLFEQEIFDLMKKAQEIKPLEIHCCFCQQNMICTTCIENKDG